jgi:hypothetical protein
VAELGSLRLQAEGAITGSGARKPGECGERADGALHRRWRAELAQDQRRARLTRNVSDVGRSRLARVRVERIEEKPVFPLMTGDVTLGGRDRTRDFLRRECLAR